MTPAFRNFSLAILISLIFFEFSNSYASESLYYVYSQNGLKMRKEPDPQSESLGTLSYGQAVKVLAKEKGEVLSVRSIRSRWSRIQTVGEESKTGYMFSGFLLPFPPPSPQATEHPLSAFLKQIKDSPGENQAATEAGKQEGESHQALIPLEDIQDAFVLLRSLYQIPDDLPFPSMFRNLYVHTDVLDKGAKDWKIHEIRVIKRSDKKISELQYSLKNYLGTLRVLVTKKGDGIFFSEEMIKEADQQPAPENSSG